MKTRAELVEVIAKVYADFTWAQNHVWKALYPNQRKQSLFIAQQILTAIEAAGACVVPLVATEEMIGEADEPFHRIFQDRAKKTVTKHGVIALASGDFSPAIYIAMLNANPFKGEGE